MKTAVMTDTNSGMSVSMGKDAGIFVLPMPVIIEDVCYMEQESVSHADVYAAMREGREFSTTQPSPGDMMELWDEILKQGYDEVIYLPMSSGLSGSCQSAIQFAKEYEGKVQVADNHRISVTLFESVLDAKAMADEGMSALQIKQRLEQNAYESSIYITVNSLEYLKKSGRVTAAGAMIASVLNLKPVLTIQGEKLDAFAKIRGMNPAMKRMLEACEQDLKERFAKVPKENIHIGVAGTFEHEEDAKKWEDQVREYFPGYFVRYLPLSCSIACHVGIDSAGIGISCIDRVCSGNER